MPPLSLSTEVIDQTPYPLSVMQQAVSEVMAESTTRSTTPELEPTHRYIEFIPATFEEYYQLLGEEDIDCIPASVLDNSEQLTEENNYATIIREGNEEPEKLYALVASDIALPDHIAYNVLTELYTPYAANSGIMDIELSQRISQRAAALVTDIHVPIMFPGTKITPKGTLKMYDSRAGKNIPMANVSITIVYNTPCGEFNCISTEVVKTDENGYFTSTRSYNKNYISVKIVWKMGRVSITDSSGNVVFTSGWPDSAGRWDVVFREPNASSSLKYCYGPLIYRAINSVFNGGGVDVLSNNNYYIQLCAVDAPGSGVSATSFKPDLSTGLYPKAIINYKDKDSYAIMKYACYELGRMCMYASDATKYITPWSRTHGGRNETIKRSWGAFAAYYFLEKEARRVGSVEGLHTMITYNGSKAQKPDDYNRQIWQCTYTIEDYYHIPVSINTPIFIDLYDNFSQFRYHASVGNTSSKFPEDIICIPDFSTIRDIAYGSNSINDVYSRIQSSTYMQKYGYTQEKINDFFGMWTYRLYMNVEDTHQWP